ncbi:TPR-like protein [Hyaloscypha variabilis F]|uniref:TPR-like protein n=1 Tax=Hyaloscypha variabilis (strain UAMH 11265 / GT02V1 / F) TaxID=1149755 RepID=A0A2J6QS88_HYAVF|nr:TPR-like protein [Hyaloscypha variabilis F]
MSTSTVQEVSGSESQKQAIDKAKAAFAKLPGGDRLFQQCVNDQGTVLEVVEALHKQCAIHKRKKFTRILESFRRYTSWMNSISGSVNVAIQPSLGIACPLWAPIKFVLKVSEDHLEAAEQTLAVIELISGNLSRLDVYERLHDDIRFKTALIDVFTEVVEFAVRAYQYFCQRASKRLAYLVKLRSHDEFGDIVARIESKTKAVDDLASVLSQVRAIEFFNEAEVKEQQERRMRCFQWLGAPNVRESHQTNLASRVGTTCEWVLTNPVLKTWLEPDLPEQNTRTVVIRGPAGCGKSVLGSFIFDTLERRKSTNRLVTAMFSFSAVDANRRTLISMVRSLLSQLLEQDIHGKLLPLFESLMMKTPLSTPEMSNIFGEAMQLLSCPTKIVIDGIDECEDLGCNVYSSLLQISLERSTLHILFLGQPQAFKVASDSITNPPTICITSAINHEDIRAFVDFQITQSTLLATSSVRDMVSSSLLTQADGMFLWVKLMLDDLKRAATDSEITSRLEDLPRGLEKAYGYILKRLVARLDKYQQKLVRRIFVLATTCGRPLETEELRYACAMMAKLESGLTKSSTDSFLLRLPPEDIVDLCGGLLTFHGGVFHIVHSSVRDFLGRPADCWSDPESRSTQVFRVSSGDSHAAISDACIRYLSEVDCSELQWDQVPSLEKLKSQPPLLQYTCSFVSYHLNRSELSADQLMDKVQCLLASDQCFFVAEYLLMIGISDSSLEPQLEFITLIQKFQLEEARLSKLIDVIIARAEEELSARISKFGETDPRTRRWIKTQDIFTSLISLVNDLIVSESASAMDIGPPNDGGKSSSEASIDTSEERSGDPKSSTEKAVQKRPTNPGHSQSHFEADICSFDRAGLGNEHLLKLLHASHDFSLGYQFEIFVGFIGQIAHMRRALDPLKVLWQYIKRKATSMPVLLLAAAALYYHQFEKNEQALELCNICLARLTKRDKMLKVALDDLAGYINYALEKYDSAIEHFEKALPIEEQWLGSKRLWLLNAQYVLADCYFQTSNSEKALQFLNKMLQNGIQSLQSSRVADNPSNMSMPPEMSMPHQNGFIMTQVTKLIENSRDSRSKLSLYDIDLLVLEIKIHQTRGIVLRRLKRPQEAIRSFQRSLELSTKIIGGLKPADPCVEKFRVPMLIAYDWIAITHFEERRDEDAIKAILKAEEIFQEVPKSRINNIMHANHKIHCACIFGSNPGKFGFTVQFAQDAIRASIVPLCQTFGAKICTGELHYWFTRVKNMLDVNNHPKPEDESGPFNQAIGACKRFLDHYVEIHEQEPLRTLHNNYESFESYYELGELYHQAKQTHNAIEALERCIQICEGLWTPTPEKMLFSCFFNSWITLSSLYSILGHLSESARAIRRALDLAEEFPQHLGCSYSMEKLLKLNETAHQHLEEVL